MITCTLAKCEKDFLTAEIYQIFLRTKNLQADSEGAWKLMLNFLGISKVLKVQNQ